MNDEKARQWWERAWLEREDELRACFGISHPPGSPADYVISISWPDLIIAGACVQVFPPDFSGPRAPLVRTDWLYLTLGLSQPTSKGAAWEGVGMARENNAGLSGYGAEFGILVSEPEDWIADFLRYLMRYVYESAPVRGGHRIPFGYYRLDDEARSWFVGPADEAKPLDETAALLFWPMLTQRGGLSLTTSTGEFEILIGTAITAAEYMLAKQTSSGHLLLLLLRAGIGQRTIFGRPSVTSEQFWLEEWRKIVPLNYDQITEEIANHGSL